MKKRNIFHGLLRWNIPSLPLRQQESKPVEKSTGFFFLGPRSAVGLLRRWPGTLAPGAAASAGPLPFPLSGEVNVQPGRFKLKRL